jgi:insulin receptor
MIFFTLVGNIVKELESGLGMITDIMGYLKITRSYPLLSLNFLKSLKVIHGIDEKGGKVENSFIVTDNPNLLDLWDWENHGPIAIRRGKLFFHFNPKLCYEKIEALKPMANDTEFNDLEVARNSNGDKIACNITKLNITIRDRRTNGVLLGWEQFKYDDPRALLGYVVYYTEALYQNVTIYDGRDACGGDG